VVTCGGREGQFHRRYEKNASSVALKTTVCKCVRVYCSVFQDVFTSIVFMFYESWRKYLKYLLGRHFFITNVSNNIFGAC